MQQSTASQHAPQADRTLPPPTPPPTLPPPSLPAPLPPPRSCAKPIGRRIFFAGEHTRADYPGTTNGALLSGQQAARDLLKAPAQSAEDSCVHGVWVRNGTGCVGLAGGGAV
jgi:hypothetical protein